MKRATASIQCDAACTLTQAPRAGLRSRLSGSLADPTALRPLYNPHTRTHGYTDHRRLNSGRGKQSERRQVVRPIAGHPGLSRPPFDRRSPRSTQRFRTFCLQVPGAGTHGRRDVAHAARSYAAASATLGLRADKGAIVNLVDQIVRVLALDRAANGLRRAKHLEHSA